MHNQGLVSYIYTNLKKGYDLNQLRTFLYNHGYPIQDIDDSIRHVQQYYPDAFPQQQVPTQPGTQPTGAINQNQQPQVVHHKVEISKGSIFFVLFLFILLPGLGYLGFKSFTGGPDKLLDITADPLTTSVKAGEPVKFTVTLESFGSDERFDTTINARLYDEENKVLDKKQIVKAVETKSSEVMELLVPPGTPAGRYQVVIDLAYKDVIEQASFMFSVGDSTTVEVPTCTDKKQNQGETGVDCGGPCAACQTNTDPSCSDGKKNQGELKADCGGPCPACSVSCQNCVPLSPCTSAECIDGQCVYTEQKPCCGNFYCEETEAYENCPADCERERDDSESPIDIKDKAEELAETDAEEAARLCSTITDEKVKDDCFKDVSHISEESVLCSYIESTSVKDACYMDAALRKDFSVCDKIQDRHHKSTCKQLQQMENLDLPAGI